MLALIRQRWLLCLSMSQENQYVPFPKSVLGAPAPGSYMLHFLIPVKNCGRGEEEMLSKCFCNEWTNWKTLSNGKQTWLKCWLHGTDCGGGFPSSPPVYSWSWGMLSPRSKHFNVNDWMGMIPRKGRSLVLSKLHICICCILSRKLREQSRCSGDTSTSCNWLCLGCYSFLALLSISFIFL